MSYTKLYSYDDFLSFLSKSGYGEAAKKKKNSLDASLEEQLAALENQKRSINDNSDELARQAYVSYISASKELPEKLTASGLNGGVADNLYLSLANEYQNNYNEIGKERLDKLYQTDYEKTKARLSNSAEYSKALSELYDSAVEKFLGIRENEENRNFESYYKDQDNAQKNADRELEKYINDMLNEQKNADRDLERYKNDTLNEQKNADRELEKYINDMLNSQKNADRDLEKYKNDTLNEQKNADRELERYINDMLNAQKIADRDLEKYKNDTLNDQKNADRETQTAQEKLEAVLELAKIAYQTGDSALLNKLGIKTSDTNQSNKTGNVTVSDLEKQLDYAVSLAKYGNYSLLCKITGLSEEEVALKFSDKKESGYSESQIRDAAKLFMSGDYSNNVLGILKSAYPEFSLSQIWKIWKSVAETEWLMYIDDDYKGPRS